MKAEMFNKKAALESSKPDEILRTLSLKSGQKVADIGSGGGYFTMRFADAVGDSGKVYAVDKNKDFLNYIASEADAKGLSNIHTIAIDGEVTLPEKVDLIFMRNLYHHLEDRTKYLEKLKSFFSPSARLVIIEHKPDTGGFLSFHKLFGHSTPREKIIEEVEAGGYQLLSEHELPEQSFLIFVEKERI